MILHKYINKKIDSLNEYLLKERELLEKHNKELEVLHSSKPELDSALVKVIIESIEDWFYLKMNYIKITQHKYQNEFIGDIYNDEYCKFNGDNNYKLKLNKVGEITESNIDILSLIHKLCPFYEYSIPSNIEILYNSNKNVYYSLISLYFNKEEDGGIKFGIYFEFDILECLRGYLENQKGACV